jgi:transpeptidase family protein/penicillin-binding protein/MecA-like transpeptidase family protein
MKLSDEAGDLILSRIFGLLGALVVGLIAAVALTGSGGPTASQRLAEGFVTAWTQGNYAQMYADVDAATRAKYSITAFADFYRNDLATATATGARVGEAQRPHDGTVTVPVTVETSLFGVIQTSFVLPIAGSGSGQRIVWRRSLGFPGVRRGESLTRQTTTPPRASLLARDETPLDSLSSASGVIGSLGPIPADQAQLDYEAGYPPDATVGQDGLQLIFNRRLTGKIGGVLLAGTRILASATPQAAAPLRTSLSPKLQSLAVSTLDGQLGGIVVMRPDTGEILALAGDPFSELQPPGSTFKMVTVTGVLLAGLATPTTVFPYATSTTIDGYKLQNANGESCGGSLALAFAVSCNSVFAPLGVRLGGAGLVNAAERFGFNQTPPIPDVAESTIPPANEIGGDLDVGSSAIGQGMVQATVLQMAMIAATIADGGQRPVPTLALGDDQPKQSVIPLSVAKSVTQLMIGVVAHGTGTLAQIPGVLVAGKTGTAELTTTAVNCTPDPTDPSSCPPAQPDNPKNTDAWFVAFAPAQKPRVVVGILLDNDGAGGDTAAPLAKILLEAALKTTAATKPPATPPASASKSTKAVPQLRPLIG